MSIPEPSGWQGRGGRTVLQILPPLFSPSLLSPRSDIEHSQHSSGSPTLLFMFQVAVTSPEETGPEKLVLSQQCEIIRRLLHFPLLRSTCSPETKSRDSLGDFSLRSLSTAFIQSNIFAYPVKAKSISLAGDWNIGLR